MASLYGISLKNIKEFEGRSGQLMKGDLYIGRTKIGGFTDVDGGAAPDIYMEEPYAYNRFMDALEKHQPEARTSSYEDFLYDLTCMTQDEDQYKKIMKNGNSVMVVQSVAYLLHYIPIKKGFETLADEELTERLKPILDENMKADGGKSYTTKIYRSLKEFEQGEPIFLEELKAKV